MLSEFDNPPDECDEWRADGFKCIDANECEDGYFDNQGGVPAIRNEYDEYIDISKVNNST